MIDNDHERLFDFDYTFALAVVLLNNLAFSIAAKPIRVVS